MTQIPLYSGIKTPRTDFRWPNLIGHRTVVAFDTETTGLDVYGDDTPVGFGVVVRGGEDAPREYISWGHLSGPYLDKEASLRWARDNLLDGNKTLVGANLKFDFKMMQKVGLDFEGKVQHRDVLHEAALLDPDRRKNNLDLISQEFLGRRKIDPGKTPIWQQPSNIIELYCVNDCDLAYDLDQELMPRLEKYKLTKVLEVEQRLTWAVKYMEDQGLRLDLDKLNEWRSRCQTRYVQRLMRLSNLAGFKVDPGSRADKVRLFTQAGITSFPTTTTGQPSFTMEWMEQFDEIETIRLLREATHLSSFKSKYLDKYWEAASSDGTIRFSLHQLRTDSHGDDDDKGTGTGRFSASAPGKGVPGFNPQQVFKVKEQKKIPVLKDMIVRELFVEDDEHEFFSADASQIEYRFFAHYVDDDAVTKRYQQDPQVDFHQIVADWIQQDRDTVAKHANFACLFGAGIDKFAYMINKSPDEAKEIWELYHRSFPGVRRLSNDVQRVAEERGYVKTILGRLRWLKGMEWKGLNTICQGSAADYAKLTVIDVYEHREELGVKLRGVVHDELIGGLRGDSQDLLDFLNRQRLPQLRVPITWGVKTGRSWNI